MPSFFALPPFDAKTLQSYEFFLVYHGNGYTYGDVQNMPIDKLQEHVARLYEQLTEERRAHEAAARRARSVRR